MVIALDAADPGLVREFARAGEMPNVARLLGESAQVQTLAPMGVFVGANWPTLFTATRPDRHGFLCWDEFRGGTYEYRETDPTIIRGTPLWEHLSEAGKRVAVIDVPHALARPVNGAMVVEWGCHDRHLGTASWPPELADELADRHGRHYGSMEPPGRDQFAPCDYRHRAGGERTPEEAATLFEDILAGIENKRAVSLDLLDRGGWDFFFNVMGESHCVGHQLWHLHEREHPRYDAAAAALVTGDPMREVYRRLDGVVGDHLARLGPEDTAYLVMAHGMAAHHDGTHLLDQVLGRLDWGLDNPGGFGAGTRAAAEAARWIPGPLRGRSLRLAASALGGRAGSPPPDALPPLPERRWFLTPNNTVVGAVRLNLAGREPAGRVRPEDRRDVLRWLSRRLGELVNLDTGGPVVRRCVVADDVYRRTPGDALGDLYVEWERSAPIERVWSPATGTVAVPYGHWRQGDHVREGLTLARGPGIRPGARRGVFEVADLGATFARAAGGDMPGVDGIPIASILPAGSERPAVRAEAAARARRSLAGRAERTLRRAAERRVPGWAARRDAGPAPTAGADTQLDEARAQIASLSAKVDELERHSQILSMTAWLEQADVAEDLLISVVMATRDRCGLLAEAIASVQAQSYSRWELLVVDDGSSDGTAAFLAANDDPRVRALRSGGSGTGECVTRNVGLDAARGDVIVYLDDDNRFHPQWLKAVAATYAALPDTAVAYGARICDDQGRQWEGVSSGRPWLQFARWEPEALQVFNITDTNVLAHRRSEERFDESLGFYGDWDLLLRLSAGERPVEIPAVAAFYRTDVAGRMSNSISQDEIDRAYRAVLAKRESRTAQSA